MLFLDLDGTLIGPEQGVRASLMTALLAARDAGLRMAVCTGRPGLGLAGRIGAQLAPDGPHIYDSGASIVSGTGVVLQAHGLTPSDALALAKHSKTSEAVLEFYCGDRIFVSKMNDDTVDHARALDIEVEAADLGDVAREIEVIRAHWIARPDTIEHALGLELEGVHVARASSPVLPRNVFASITRADVDKGTSAAIVAGMWGVDLSDCYAVGDSVGDVPILEVVGHPYVMANAPAELHEKYDVLPSVHDDGVGELLDRLGSTGV